MSLPDFSNIHPTVFGIASIRFSEYLSGTIFYQSTLVCHVPFTLGSFGNHISFDSPDALIHFCEINDIEYVDHRAPFSYIDQAA